MCIERPTKFFMMNTEVLLYFNAFIMHVFRYTPLNKLTAAPLATIRLNE